MRLREPPRFYAGAAANAAAWGVFGLLFGGAVVLATVLGFAGLVLLGGATWMVCSLAQLNQDAPTWGTEVFRARMARPGSPEEAAAMEAARREFASPLRFYARCGMLLAGVGVAGFVWQA